MRAAFLLASLCLSLIALQCVEVPSSPVLPNWDTQLSVPLVDSVYHLSEAMQNNTDITVSGSEYMYSPALFVFDPVPIGPDLKLYPPFGVPQSLSQQVGPVRLDLPSPVTVNVAPSAMLGGSVPGIPVVQAPLPLSNFPSDGLPPLLNINFVHFMSGTMGLSIHNALPIPLSFPTGFQLINAGSGETVASFPATTILPHDSWNPPAAILNGVTLKNQMQFDAQFLSAGSSGSTVSYSPDSGVVVSYTFNNIMADSASAVLFHPFSQSVVMKPYIVDSLTLVKEVSFNSGKLQISLHSNLNAASTVNVSIAELRNSANAPLSFDVRMGGNASFDSVLDMREWKIAAPDGGLTNTLEYAITLKSDDFDAPTPVTVHAGDAITGALTAIEVPFAIHRLAGVSRTLEIPVEQSVDIPLGTLPDKFKADSLWADSINIRLHVNEPGHPVALTLSLVGRDKNGTAIATLDAGRQVIKSDQDAMYSFPQDKMGQFLGSFVAKQGVTVDLTGSAVVNPPEVYSMIPHQIADLQDTSNLYLSLEVGSPLQAGIINGRILDTLDIADSSSNGTHIDKDLLTSVKQASVFFVVDNAIPVGVDLSFTFLDRNGQIIDQLTMPKTHQQPIAIVAGTPSQPATSPAPIRVDLSPGEAEHFADAAKVAIAIGLNSGGHVSHFGPADYVHVRAYSNMVFNINPDKLKNK